MKNCTHQHTILESRILESATGQGHPSGAAPAEHIQVKTCRDCGAEIEPTHEEKPGDESNALPF